MLVKVNMETKCEPQEVIQLEFFLLSLSLSLQVKVAKRPSWRGDEMRNEIGDSGDAQNNATVSQATERRPSKHSSGYSCQQVAVCFAGPTTTTTLRQMATKFKFSAGGKEIRFQFCSLNYLLII